MLQLLITILLALGLKTEPVDGRYNVSQDVVQKVHNDPDYDKLGGDDALNAIVVHDDTDPHQ